MLQALFMVIQKIKTMFCLIPVYSALKSFLDMQALEAKVEKGPWASWSVHFMSPLTGSVTS